MDIRYSELKKIATERQRKYMELTGQIDANGKMLIDVNYIEFVKEEFNEFNQAREANDMLEMADALCDILVCQAGVDIQLDCNCNVWFIHPDHIEGEIDLMSKRFDFVGGLNEVFDNNLARLQFDENGKVILDMQEFLEDGTKNPKFGKVKKKDISPNLEQFFRK